MTIAPATPARPADFRPASFEALRAHERRTAEMIRGIDDKIRRLHEAKAARIAALARTRTALAEAVLAQRGPANHEK